MEQAITSYKRTVRAANIIRGLGVEIGVVSVGATPSHMIGGVIEGVTEIRPGTYLFMDYGQANAIGDFSRCAATVLATVISKPTKERVVLDAGAKALAPQKRDSGICATQGFGYVKNSKDVIIVDLYDEHGLISDEEFCSDIRIGDKIEIIPSHICPTVNLYDKADLLSDGAVIGEIPILCRGKSK